MNRCPDGYLSLTVYLLLLDVAGYGEVLVESNRFFGKYFDFLMMLRICGCFKEEIDDVEL